MKFKMTENIPTSDRIEALEKQLYVVYLQLNAVTKMLVEAKIIDQAQLIKEMEQLNEEVYKVTKEAIEKNSESDSEEVQG